MGTITHPAGTYTLFSILRNALRLYDASPSTHNLCGFTQHFITSQGFTCDAPSPQLHEASACNTHSLQIHATLHNFAGFHIQHSLSAIHTTLHDFTRFHLRHTLSATSHKISRLHGASPFNAPSPQLHKASACGTRSLQLHTKFHDFTGLHPATLTPCDFTRFHLRHSLSATSHKISRLHDFTASVRVCREHYPAVCG